MAITIIRKLYGKIVLQPVRLRLRRIMYYMKILPGTIYVKIENGSIESVKAVSCTQTRADSTIKMIADAIKLMPWERLNTSFTIYTHDYAEASVGSDCFLYCGSKESEKNKLFPDFVFDAWPQAGVDSYDSTTKEIEEAGKQKYIYDKLLWIGNVSTNRNRAVFMEIAKNNPDRICGINTNVDKYIDKTEKVPYISLIDHTQYKYLLDIEGYGYSGRVGMLLFSQRVLFIQDRKWKQYYYFDLIPYTHFIPVKNDLSDLMAQIEMVEQQGPDYYNQIANNAFLFATQNLKYKHAVHRIREIISS